MKKLLLTLIFVSLCAAQVPKLVNYQAKLTNSSGIAVNGTRNIVFRIYSSSTGGTAIWTESRTGGSAITVTNGLFDVLLGEITPLNLAFDDTYWVELTVEGETLTPREILAASPYAYRAIYADSATGVPTASTQGDVLAGNGITVTSGTDVLVGPDSRDVTVAVSFAGTGSANTASRSDHTHAGYLSSEVDGVIGNEVVNATNGTLTRSGSGTGASPYTLALNLANNNTWTGLQTFNTTSGTAPFAVDASDNGVVTNLNADLLDGYHASAFATSAHTHSNYFAQGGNAFGATATLGTTDAYALIVQTSSVERMRITTAGNVGIGTTTPLSMLSIGYGGDATAVLAVSGTQFGGYFRSTTTTNYQSAVKGEATAASGMTRGVVGTISSTTAGAAAVLGDVLGATGATYGVQGSNISTTAGAAGVYGVSNAAGTYGIYGSSTSGYAAYFNGTVGITGGLYDGASTGTAGQVLTANGSGNFSWQTPSASGITGSGAAYHVSYWDGASSQTYDSDGNFYWNPSTNRLGIGTTSPNQQLEITGNFRFPATTTTAGIIYQGASFFAHSYGSTNNFFGTNAGNLTLTSGTASYNTGVGYNSLSSLTTGFANTAVGNSSLDDNNTGNSNTAIGWGAMGSNTGGSGNIAIGLATVGNNLTGGGNIGIGNSALFNGTAVANNIAVGHGALQGFSGNTTGEYNVALGHQTMYGGSGVISGNNNIALGYRALYGVTSGGNNVALGYQAGYSNNTGTGNVFLGYQAGYSETGSSKLYIDNSNTTTPLVYGDFANDTLRVNGNFRVNGKFIDYSGAAGTSGQVLTANASGQPIWSSASGGVTSVTASSPITSSGGTTPNIALTQLGDVLSGSGITVTSGDNRIPGDDSADLSVAVNFGGTGSATTVARSDHTHSGTYDYYGNWSIAASGTAGSSTITSGETVTFSGSGITTATRSGDNITISSTEVDGSVTNEAQTLAGTGTNDINLSTAGGTGGGTITFTGGGYTSISRSGNTFTISSSGDGTGITGSGTANYLARWSAATTLTNSVIQDNGTYVGVNTAPSTSYRLYVNGMNDVAGGAGIYGYIAPSASTGWTSAGTKTAVKGYTYNGYAYCAGVFGTRYDDSAGPSAGVIGTSNQSSAAIFGALGYQDASYVEYAGYFNGPVRLTSTLYDAAGSVGTSGQILSSTGTGTSWISAAADDDWRWSSGSDVNGNIYHLGSVNIGVSSTPTGILTIRNDLSGIGSWGSGFRPQIMLTNSNTTSGAEAGIGMQVGSSDDELASGYGVILKTKLNTYVLGIVGGNGVLYSRFAPDPAASTNGAYFPGSISQTAYLTKGNSNNEITLADAGGDYTALEVGIGTYSPSQQLEITRNFKLPTTTSTTGIIYNGMGTLLHTYGTGNLFLGPLTGNLTTSGSGMNTALGYMSMRQISTGTGNTSVGTAAMDNTSTGNYNVAVGYSALSSNTSGVVNIAIGRSALGTNTVGGYNVAVGDLALWYNTAKSRSTAIGYQAMYYADNTSSAGAYSYNTAVGCQALLGNSASATNNTGQHNVAIGDSAFSNMMGGSYNVAVGSKAMVITATGTNNVAVGFIAMRNNTSGSNNVAVGDSTLYIGNTSSRSVALGHGALFSPTSHRNTAAGFRALYGNSGGGADSVNVAIGSFALAAIVTGNFNVAVGDSAGYSTTTASNNVMVGYKAQASAGTGIAIGSTASANYTNSIAIGVGCANTAANQVRIGNSSTTSYQIYSGSWTTWSDARLKENIADYNVGLDFIKKLRPVSYNYTTDGQKGIFHNGFVAQDVKSAMDALHIQFTGLDVPADTINDYYGLRYSDFVVPLVNAVQELDARIEKLEHTGNSTYTNTASDVSITASGFGKLESGKTFVRFDKTFVQSASRDVPVVVTVSPNGRCSGLFVAQVSSEGFVVEENAGSSNIEFSWIAVARKR